MELQDDRNVLKVSGIGVEAVGLRRGASSACGGSRANRGAESKAAGTAAGTAEADC